MPYTRGSEFSRSIRELIKETKDLVNNGSNEITLLGQNVNAYNYNEKNFLILFMKFLRLKT